MTASKELRKIAKSNRRAAMFPVWNDFYERLKLLKYAKRWQSDGWNLPLPDLMKRAILKSAAAEFGARMLVETGTLRGDTVWYFRDQFDRIFSIEVQPQLAALAAERFASHPHISIVEGDSAVKLADVVPQLTAPALFWLDGHYSAGTTGRGANDCPIWHELDIIVGNMTQPFLILMDDARYFGVEAGYPTIQQLREFTEAKLPAYEVFVENDIIWIRPKVSNPS